MASPTKQQKRAQRAKAKAKQNRSGKAKGQGVHPLFTNPLINKPFDAIEIDVSAFDFNDFIENGFDVADFADLYAAMHLAERISLLAMCLVFLQYPLLAVVLAEQEEEPATDFMLGLLVAYREIFHEEDEDTAVAWCESDRFIDTYSEASMLLQERDLRSGPPIRDW